MPLTFYLTGPGSNSKKYATLPPIIRRLQQSISFTKNLFTMTKNIFLAGILSLSCGLAAADWSLLIRDAYGTTYFDKEKISGREALATVWTLYDAEVPIEIRPSEYSHSARTQTEFNCQERTARALVMVSYAERMANGKVMSVKSAPSQWETINPKTWRQAVFKMACPNNKP